MEPTFFNLYDRVYDISFAKNYWTGRSTKAAKVLIKNKEEERKKRAFFTFKTVYEVRSRARPLYSIDRKNCQLGWPS